MEKSNKTIYIIIAVVLAIFAIPVVLMLLGFAFYYWMGATH